MSKGTLISIPYSSEVLKDNPLKDPYQRDIWIYLPAQYNSSSEAFPALLALNGFTGNGALFFNDSPFLEGLKTRLDRLIENGHCPPCIIVAPDCFTKFGGSQHINSTATGNYEDYLMKEIIPFVNEKYRPKSWGVFGKSSGGFSSMILGMKYPEVFQVLGNHSGDSNFELSYLPDFKRVLDKFQKAGGPTQWLQNFWSNEKPENRKDIETLNILAMSACYSPNPDSKHMGIDFPFDLDTGVFKPEIWQRWRDWDPALLISKYAENLKKLKLIYIDCGSKDQFALHWGCRAIVSECKKAAIPVHYEEFNDGHMSIAYRMDRSLPLLVKALS